MNRKVRIIAGIAALVLVIVFAVLIPVINNNKENNAVEEPAATDHSGSESDSIETENQPTAESEPTSDLAWEWPDTTGGEIEVNPASGTDLPKP